MQLTYQGREYSVTIGPAERMQALSVYRVPDDYQGGLFVALTPAGEFEQVPASRGSDTQLLLRAQLAPDEPMAIEHLAEGVSLG